MKTGSRSGGDPRLCLRGVFVSVICLWGIAEAGYGLLQVLGWRSSRHALFALTGHFNNPGPFGGFIACVMAVAVGWLMRFRVKPGMTKEWSGMTKDSSLSLRMTVVVNGIAWVALGMGLLVLPASMSRAGWLGLLVALAVEWMRSPIRSGMTKSRHSRAGGNLLRIGMGTVVVLAFIVGAFLLKPDSALGRVHVWRMEWRAIAERPWMGAGPGMGPWAYGEAQEAFFREHLTTASPATVRVAGCPDHAYNEYLGLGVEYGLPAMLFFILLILSSIVVLHKARSPLAAGLTSWSVFACASYPLAVPQLRILGAGFVIIAQVVGLMQSRSWWVGIMPVAAAVLLVGWMGSSGQRFRVKPGMTKEWPGMTKEWSGMTEWEDFRAVYVQGYALHQAGRYEESTKVLERGALMSCDPMFEVIMGKNAEALGDFGRAAALYEKAHYMVPSRLYPLVRLMRLQVRQGEDAAALETAREIVGMPVNERNAGMVRLHRDAAQALDSLKKVIGR